MSCYGIYQEEKKAVIRSNSLVTEEEKEFDPRTAPAHSNTTTLAPETTKPKPAGLFAALLPQWETTLRTNGVTDGEMREFPKACYGAFALVMGGGLKPMPSGAEFDE